MLQTIEWNYLGELWADRATGGADSAAEGGVGGGEEIGDWTTQGVGSWLPGAVDGTAVTERQGRALGGVDSVTAALLFSGVVACC